MNFKSDKKGPSISCIYTQKLCISKWNYGLSAINQFNSVHLAYYGVAWIHCIFVAFVNGFTHNFAKSNWHLHIECWSRPLSFYDAQCAKTNLKWKRERKRGRVWERKKKLPEFHNYRIRLKCSEITLIGRMCLSHTIQASCSSCRHFVILAMWQYFFLLNFCLGGLLIFGIHSYSHSHSNSASSVSYYVAILVLSGATFLPVPHTISAQFTDWMLSVCRTLDYSSALFVYTKVYGVQVFEHSVLVARLLPACHCQNDIGCHAISMRFTLCSVTQAAQPNQIQWKRTEINDYRFVDLSVSMGAWKPHRFSKRFIRGVHCCHFYSIFWTHRVNIDFATEILLFRYFFSSFFYYFFLRKWSYYTVLHFFLYLNIVDSCRFSFFFLLLLSVRAFLFILTLCRPLNMLPYADNSYQLERISICDEKSLAMWDYYNGIANKYDFFGNL